MNQAQANDDRPNANDVSVSTQRGLHLFSTLPAMGVKIAATHGWMDMYSVASVCDQPNCSITGVVNRPAWFPTRPTGTA